MGQQSVPPAALLNVFANMHTTIEATNPADVLSSPAAGHMLDCMRRMLENHDSVKSSGTPSVYTAGGALALHGAAANGTPGLLRQIISAMTHHCSLRGEPFDVDVCISPADSSIFAGCTPLHVLCICCNNGRRSADVADIAVALLRAGASAKRQTPAGVSAVHLAAAACHPALVDALVRTERERHGRLAAAITVQTVAPEGASVLHHMAEAMMPLVQAAEDADAGLLEGDMVQVEHAGRGSSGAPAALLAVVPAPHKDADVPLTTSGKGACAAEARDDDDVRPSLCARCHTSNCHVGEPAQGMPSTLLSVQEEVSASAVEALLNRTHAVCKSLVAAGALVRARNSHGLTALHVAALCGNAPFAEAVALAVQDMKACSLWSAMKSVTEEAASVRLYRRPLDCSPVTRRVPYSRAHPLG